METLRNSIHRPTHPGEVLREDVLPALGLTQGEFAANLGVSRRTVSEIIHERRPVTPDMAIRLAKFLGNGPGIWLRIQQALDIWELTHGKNMKRYQKIKPLKIAA